MIVYLPLLLFVCFGVLSLSYAHAHVDTRMHGEGWSPAIEQDGAVAAFTRPFGGSTPDQASGALTDTEPALNPRLVADTVCTITFLRQAALPDVRVEHLTRTLSELLPPLRADAIHLVGMDVQTSTVRVRIRFSLISLEDVDSIHTRLLRSVVDGTLAALLAKNGCKYVPVRRLV